jgi:hypothetical protein
MKTDTSAEAIAELLSGTTPGPWGVYDWKDKTKRHIGVQAEIDICAMTNLWTGRADANARFVAAARELVPALAAERDMYWNASMRMMAERDAQQSSKDAAYLERNKLVALLAAIFSSGIKRTAIEGWSDNWHGCVYIDFPWGQASWHYHDSQADLFAHLPPYVGDWDGHTTEAKYEAIVAASRNRPTSAVDGYLADVCAARDAAIARAEAAEARVAELTGALRRTADQALTSEIPDGYGPDQRAEWGAGYDAAISFARNRLAPPTDQTEVK